MFFLVFRIRHGRTEFSLFTNVSPFIRAIRPESRRGWLVCLLLRLEDWCICRPFGSLDLRPHLGYLFALLLSSLLLSLLGSRGLGLVLLLE